MRTKRSAFTLIELLIVVAIIAILAAIAVPNFLEAQVRAKVSRIMADFRAEGTALESYRVDNTDYPPELTSDSGDTIEPPGLRLAKLTTPVAYTTKILSSSPFKAPGEGDGWWNYPQYTTSRELRLWSRGGAPGANGESGIQLNGLYRLAAGQQPELDRTDLTTSVGSWILLDRGPDLAYYYVWANPTWVTPTFMGNGGVGQAIKLTAVLYDPTNGSLSEGELARVAK